MSLLLDIAANSWNLCRRTLVLSREAGSPGRYIAVQETGRGIESRPWVCESERETRMRLVSFVSRAYVDDVAL